MPQFGTARFTAMAFQEAWNSAVQSNSQTDLTILNDVAQIDVRWAISELEKINCTLRQAVDFFLLHALPEGGFLKFDEAMDRYYEIQKRKTFQNLPQTRITQFTKLTSSLLWISLVTRS